MLTHRDAITPSAPDRGLTLLESGRVVGARQVAGTSAGMLMHVGLLSAVAVLASIDYRTDLALEQQRLAELVEETTQPVFLAPEQQRIEFPSEARPLQQVAMAAEEAGDGPPGPVANTTVETIGDDEVQEVTIPAPAVENFVLTEIEVDSAVATDPSSGGPAYPIAMLDANLEGEVLARFIVDTTGRADPTSFTALQSTHSAFTNSVRDALRVMKFRPARLQGRTVAQLVVQSFAFRITAPPPPDTVLVPRPDTVRAGEGDSRPHDTNR